MISSPANPPEPFQPSAVHDPFATSIPATAGADPFVSSAPAPAYSDPFASPAPAPAATGFSDPFASVPASNDNDLQARINAKLHESEGKAAPRPLTAFEQEELFTSNNSPSFGSPGGNSFTDPFVLPSETKDPFGSNGGGEQSTEPPAVRDYMASFEQQRQRDEQKASNRGNSKNSYDDSSSDEEGYSPSSSARSPPSEQSEETYEAYFDESVKKYGMLLEKAKRLPGEQGLANISEWIGTGGDRLSSSSALRYSHGSVGGDQIGPVADDRTSVEGALQATTYTHECRVDEGVGEAEVTAVKLVVDDGASAAAGITVGSVLLSVNGVSVQHLSYKQSLKLVREATRPTTLKFIRVTRPFDLSHGDILARVSNGSWSVGGLRKGRANWSNKYYAFGGPQGDVFQLFDSRLAYQQASVDSVERKKSRHRVLTFKLHEQYRCGRVKCKPYRSHGQLYYFKLKVPSLAFVPAKFASPDRQAVQLLHDTLTVKLNKMKMNAGRMSR